MTPEPRPSQAPVRLRNHSPELGRHPETANLQGRGEAQVLASHDFPVQRGHRAVEGDSADRHVVARLLQNRGFALPAGRHAKMPANDDVDALGHPLKERRARSELEPDLKSPVVGPKAQAP
jgi:hypothetical protein